MNATMYFIYAGIACRISGPQRHIQYLKRCWDKSPYARYVQASLPPAALVTTLRLVVDETAGPEHESFGLVSNERKGTYTLSCSQNMFFIYPIVEQVLRKIFHYAFFRRGGFILHASAVAVDGRAHIFLGKSDSGKSTVARLASSSPGVSLLADNNVYVMPEDGTFWAHPPAFLEWYVDAALSRTSGKYPIAGLYFLRKSAVAGKQPVDFGEAFSVIYSELHIPATLAAPSVARVNSNLFTMLGGLSRTGSVCRLGFALTTDVAGLLRGN